MSKNSDRYSITSPHYGRRTGKPLFLESPEKESSFLDIEAFKSYIPYRTPEKHKKQKIEYNLEDLKNRTQERLKKRRHLVDEEMSKKIELENNLRQNFSPILAQQRDFFSEKKDGDDLRGLLGIFNSNQDCSAIQEVPENDKPSLIENIREKYDKNYLNGNSNYRDFEDHYEAGDFQHGAGEQDFFDLDLKLNDPKSTKSPRKFSPEVAKRLNMVEEQLPLQKSKKRLIKKIMKKPGTSSRKRSYKKLKIKDEDLEIVESKHQLLQMLLGQTAQKQKLKRKHRTPKSTKEDPISMNKKKIKKPSSKRAKKEEK